MFIIALGTGGTAIGKNIFLIIPPGYVTEKKMIIERILNNEIIGNYETIRCRKGGEQFNVTNSISFENP